MEKYILILNDGVFYEYGSNVFSYKSLMNIFVEELDGRYVEMDLENEVEEREEVSIERGIEMLIEGKYKCYNMFVEMGDDYSELRVIKLEER